MVYEVVSVIRRKKQIMYQYFAIVLITMLLSQIEGKYIEYVLLFSILILGQNVVSYNVQNELRLVKKGFPLRYSLKEKLQCKSVIGMFLLLLPMLCYWIAYKFELFSILLWIWMPIQSIIIYTAKEPAAKVTIYTSILYFVIVIYESMVDVFNNKIIDFLSKTAYNLSRNILLLSTVTGRVLSILQPV